MSYSLSQATNTLLFNLVMEIKSGNIRRCEALGLEPEEMRLLRELSSDDLLYLSESKVSVLDVRIHHENLSILLTQARREQKRQERIDRALALGASIEMMHQYFGLEASEVSARRRLEGIQTRKGRNSSPEEDKESVLWQQWRDAGMLDPESTEGLDVMMLMAEEQNVNLTTVWTRVKAWIRMNAAGAGMEVA